MGGYKRATDDCKTCSEYDVAERFLKSAFRPPTGGSYPVTPTGLYF